IHGQKTSWTRPPTGADRSPRSSAKRSRLQSVLTTVVGRPTEPTTADTNRRPTRMPPNIKFSRSITEWAVRGILWPFRNQRRQYRVPFSPTNQCVQQIPACARPFKFSPLIAHRDDLAVGSQKHISPQAHTNRQCAQVLGQGILFRIGKIARLQSGE